MRNILIIWALVVIFSCSSGKYIPIEETAEMGALRLELVKEMKSPSYFGLVPQSDPPDFEYKIENRILAMLYFSENGLFFEGKLMTNYEFEEALFNLKKKKAKETKNKKGLWIYIEQDGDSDEAYFIDALIIIRKLDMYSQYSEGEYGRERQKLQSQQ